MSDWIKCSDMMPGISGKYIVHILQKEGTSTFFTIPVMNLVDVCTWSYDELQTEIIDSIDEIKRIYRKEWKFDHCYRDNIVEWMPLPSPPEEVDDE